MRLGVFAPSSGFDPTRFEAGIAVLEGLGFTLKHHPQIHERNGFLAGSDEARTNAFFELLEDDEVDALIAARGGYGAHRLLPRLDDERIASANKPVVGFSDVCAIHARLLANGGRPIHGPVVTQMSVLPTEDHDALVRLLSGEPPAPIEADGAVIAGGVAEGPLVGGCLSVMTPLVGTPYAPPIDGAVLLLEDVTELPYRIDRQLTHLRLSGWLDRVAGVALGDFVKCDPPRDGEQTIHDVLHERLSDLGIPVVAGFPVGHGARNRAVPLGARVRLDADRRTLTFGQGPT